MVRILGSIDNASIGGHIHHLIFTANEILQFQVMENNERQAILGNAPEYTSLHLLRHHSAGKDLFHEISGICLERGRYIEEHVDDYLITGKGYHKSMDYSAITDVVLSGGNIDSIHSLSFKCREQEVKYFLVREGGNVPGEVFTSYKNALNMAFPDNWSIRKGVRMRKMGLPALKIGALGTVPVSAAIFLLAIFQHETVTSAFTIALIFYAIFLGVLSGVSHQVLIHRRLKELQPTIGNR